MTSTARIEANRRNAQKSTGPRTDEGKARASQNALKHGLAAQSPVLPHDPASEYQTALESWTNDLQPCHAVETALVELAARATVRLRRCARAEDARIATQTQHARYDFERQQRDRAHELGTKLLFDPLNRYMAVKTDPESLRKLNLWRAVEPAVVVRELESTSAGVSWMLARWGELHNILEDELYWHYPEKFAAIRLMGKRTDDGLSDSAVARIMVACQVLHPEPLTLQEDFEQAGLGREGRPMYDQRVASLKPLLPSREEALEWLREVVARESARLREMKTNRLDPLHVSDRQHAVIRAEFDVSPEAALARRYESACQRDLHRAIQGLLKLRGDRARPATEPVSFDETPDVVEVSVSEPAMPSEPEPEAAAVKAPAPNGPNRRARRAAERLSRRRERGANGAVPGPITAGARASAAGTP